jgi:hypothetical protein
MLIYGSTAIKHWFPDYPKQPNDLDIISKEPIARGSNTEVYWIDVFDYLLAHNKDKEYVDPDLLYTIKVSHCSWNINWEKHISDIQFLQLMGCKLDKPFYDLLIKEWETIHSKKNFSFNKLNEELFNDSVNRKYSHDDLHMILKFNDVPMYKKVQKNKDNALCDESLFNNLSDKEKLELAVEEVAVIAYERYILPKNAPVKHSLVKAYKDLVTRMTKGWFNLYLIEHSKDIIFLQKYYQDYFNFIIKKGSGL